MLLIKEGFAVISVLFTLPNEYCERFVRRESNFLGRVQSPSSRIFEMECAGGGGGGGGVGVSIDKSWSHSIKC